WAEEWHMLPRTSFRSVLWSWISATGIFCGDISISAAARKAYRLDVTVVATVGGKGAIKESRIFCLKRGTLVPYFPLPVTAYLMQEDHSGTDSTDGAKIIFFNCGISQLSHAPDRPSISECNTPANASAATHCLDLSLAIVNSSTAPLSANTTGMPHSCTSRLKIRAKLE
ncbi:hypothetical protein KIW84_054633, partial [Lathyrus oleraceus]